MGRHVLHRDALGYKVAWGDFGVKDAFGGFVDGMGEYVCYIAFGAGVDGVGEFEIYGAIGGVTIDAIGSR